MTHLEFPPIDPTFFTITEVLKNNYGKEYIAKQIVVHPDRIDGFDETKISKEVTASIVSNTFNGMLEQAVKVMEVDAYSPPLEIQVSSYFLAAMEMGGRILNELAPRLDGTLWRDWLEDEFAAVADKVYGDDADKYVDAYTELLTPIDIE